MCFLLFFSDVLQSSFKTAKDGGAGSSVRETGSSLAERYHPFTRPIACRGYNFILYVVIVSYVFSFYYILIYIFYILEVLVMSALVMKLLELTIDIGGCRWLYFSHMFSKSMISRPCSYFSI